MGNKLRSLTLLTLALCLIGCGEEERPHPRDMSLSELLGALENREKGTRAYIIEYLLWAASDAEDVVPILKEILYDDEASDGERENASGVLLYFEPEGSAIVSEALNGPDRALRLIVMRSMRRKGPISLWAAPDLIAALQEPDEKVVLDALYALAEVSRGRLEVLPVFHSFARHESDAICRATSFALRHIDPKELESALPLLIHGMKHDDHYVRLEAWASLQALTWDSSPESVTEAVVGLYRERDLLYPETRAFAISLLSRLALRDAALIPIMAEATHDKDAEVRLSAVYAIGAWRSSSGGRGGALMSETIAKTLSVAVIDPDLKVQQATALILRNIGRGATPATGNLTIALESSDEVLRASALQALYFAGPAPEAVPSLIAIVNDPDESDTIRGDAVLALGQAGQDSAEAFDVLFSLALGPKSDTDYLWERATLGLSMTGPDNIERIAELLENTDVSVRAIVPLALRPPYSSPSPEATYAERYGPRVQEKVDRSVPVLVRGLGDRSSDVRILSARSLGQIGPDAGVAIPDLVEALDRWDFDTALAAAHALAQLGVQADAAVPVLAKGLNRRRSREVYRETCRALERYGVHAKEAIPSLKRSIKNPGRAGPIPPLSTLAAIDPAEALPLAIALLSSPERRFRKQSCSILARLGSDAREAIPALIKTLNDSDHRTRASAVYALGAIGSAEGIVIEALERATVDPDYFVRDFARKALAELNDKGP